MTAIPNSTFLDFAGNTLATQQQFATIADTSTPAAQAAAEAVLADLFGDGTTPATVTDSQDEITVALVLKRASDPASLSALLSGNWATRQSALADQASIWQDYGADPKAYGDVNAAAIAAVGTNPGTLAAATGYLSSVFDRTIWLTVSPDHFTDLFGQTLLKVKSKSADTQAWAGDLTLNDAYFTPDDIKNIGGIWVETSAQISNPLIQDNTGTTILAGPQGIGNGLSGTPSQLSATPTAVAANYDFPLGTSADTPAIALVEGNVPDHAAIQASLDAYRQAIGLDPMKPDGFEVVSGTDAPLPPLPDTVSGELTLDTSVLAGAAPKSQQLLYSDLGGTPFNAYQQAFFDSRDAGVLSSSYAIPNLPTADSPFQWAYQQLFIDGALSNVSVQIAAGDTGAAGFFATGAANGINSNTPAYALAVGGTSIATRNSAGNDPTLATLLQQALSNDPATIFGLVAAGLQTLPQNLVSTPFAFPATTLTSLVESAWNELNVTVYDAATNTLDVPIGGNIIGSGGVTGGVPVPSYQSAFGLDLLGPDGAGRASPDVSALSSGDAHYAYLSPLYVSDNSTPVLAGTGGTSAASPLWAALTAQFDAIFDDQGLPRLGFYNDLLYTAAVIAPASFNDITLGDNYNGYVESATPTAYYDSTTKSYIIPTGQGYAAGPGYDLVSGLGTPNGTLLARALTQIAQAQTNFPTSPNVIDSNGSGGWTSGADQNLLYQTNSSAAVNVNLFAGSGSASFTSAASSAYAWTSRLAEQSLQQNFDPALVVMFDKQSQGTVMQGSVTTGGNIAVGINGTVADAAQATLSTSFGFADFDSTNSDSSLRIARPVMVAETAGGADDQNVVVRLRQGGQDSLSLMFYEVDDLNGTIDGVAPGAPTYAKLAADNAYHTVSGDTSINGPGYGAYKQTELTGVDAGDFIAMELVNNSHGNTYWEFAQANETVGGQSVSHIWNYGANTWGWEDTYSGGDRDYNDMVVGVDFTSTAGHGLLV